jgi:hypothetical protein
LRPRGLSLASARTAERREGEGGGEGGRGEGGRGEGREGEGRGGEGGRGEGREVRPRRRTMSVRMQFLPRGRGFYCVRGWMRTRADVRGRPDGHFHPKTSVMTSLARSLSDYKPWPAGDRWLSASLEPLPFDRQPLVTDQHLDNHGRWATSGRPPAVGGCPKLALPKFFLLLPAHIFLHMWSILASWLEHMLALTRLFLEFSDIHNF